MFRDPALPHLRHQVAAGEDGDDAGQRGRHLGLPHQGNIIVINIVIIVIITVIIMIIIINCHYHCHHRCLHHCHHHCHYQDGSTAMHRAVATNNVEAVRTMLELGASPNYRDR